MGSVRKLPSLAMDLLDDFHFTIIILFRRLVGFMHSVYSKHLDLQVMHFSCFRRIIKITAQASLQKDTWPRLCQTDPFSLSFVFVCPSHVCPVLAGS